MTEGLSTYGGNLHFRIFSRTDVGKRRQRNEDSLAVIARHGVFLVADGMGGVDGGDFSSQKVIEGMVRSFESLEPGVLEFADLLTRVETSICDASVSIKKEAELRGINGMGTTVVVICFDMKGGNDACVMHVGDSRLYRYRHRRIECMTVDHSLAAESGIKDSAMIPMFMAGVITRAVGVREDVQVERTSVDVTLGDLFLLCSDGLYNMVSDDQIDKLLSLNSVDPAAELVNTANDAGGFDNITVVLIEVRKSEDDSGQLDDTVT
jgi:serine/threonine protein phosphatase PrpC